MFSALYNLCACLIPSLDYKLIKGRDYIKPLQLAPLMRLLMDDTRKGMHIYLVFSQRLPSTRCGEGDQVTDLTYRIPESQILKFLPLYKAT